MLLGALTLARMTSAHAAESCTPVVGELVSVEGQVEVQHEAADWQRAALGASLCQRDSVRVGPRSRGTIALINDAILRLDQNTTVNLLEIVREPEERSLIDLVIGAFQSFSRSPRTMAVSTPYLNATIEGTEFALRAEPQRTWRTQLVSVAARSSRSCSSIATIGGTPVIQVTR